MDNMHPQLRDFIMFCVERAGKEWPGICDEMANVAGRRLYKGMGHAELKDIGLFLGISNVEKLRLQVEQVVSEYEKSTTLLIKKELSLPPSDTGTYKDIAHRRDLW